MADLDALRLADADGNHGMVSVFPEAGLPAVQGNDAALHRRIGRTRRIGWYLELTDGQELIADEHFLGDRGKLNHRGLAGAHDFCNAEVNSLVSKRYLAVGV